MAKKYSIRCPHDPQFPAQDRDIAALLGRKGSKWPDVGVPETALIARERVDTKVQDVAVFVWVTPKPVKDGRKSSKHRVMCRCPGCSTVLSVARLKQHLCA